MRTLQRCTVSPSTVTTLASCLFWYRVYADVRSIMTSIITSRLELMTSIRKAIIADTFPDFAKEYVYTLHADLPTCTCTAVHLHYRNVVMERRRRGA